MQTDPIGYSDGLNWYAYVGNDPMNGTDPSGSWRIPALQEERRRKEEDEGEGDNSKKPRKKRPTEIMADQYKPKPSKLLPSELTALFAQSSKILIAGGVGKLSNTIAISIYSKTLNLSLRQHLLSRMTLSKHGLQQAMSRNVPLQTIKEAVLKGRISVSKTDKTAIVFSLPASRSLTRKGARVVINRYTGKIITVVNKGSKFK